VTLEVILMWAAVTLYAIGAVLFIIGFVFGVKPATRIAIWVSLAGLVPQLGAIIVRWQRVGHAPYLGFYEVISGFAFVTVLTLGLLMLKYPDLGVVGVVLMPLAFLLLGGSMLAPKADVAVTPKLASWWLTIHVSFAKLCYCMFILSVVFAAVYLIRMRPSKGGTFRGVLDKLPPQEIVDDLTFKFIAAGFIFLGIMIAAGAIWANEAWGRYWAWDPIETWSLIAWIIYAVVLHLRLTMGWRGQKFAWAAVVALPAVLFSLVGVPIVYQSIHGAYLTGIELKPGQ
jgi:cytochrome c-type biogenesis protein CcsB